VKDNLDFGLGIFPAIIRAGEDWGIHIISVIIGARRAGAKQH
jgi:hypothetical protein